jgi:hypothetical protein
MFGAVDLNRRGSITAAEFANVQFAGSPFGIELAKKVVKVFDKVSQYFSPKKFLIAPRTTQDQLVFFKFILGSI